jgi:hypothetical protein
MQGTHAPSAEPPVAIDLGWPEFERALESRSQTPLTFGAIHEFFGLAPTDGTSSRLWHPPLALLLYLASRPRTQIDPHQPAPASLILWIGRKVWPSGFSLQATPGLLDRSILIDATDEAERLWAIDVALRSSTSPASIVVVADGSGLSLASTRRLQLAAEAGRSIALLARPPREQTALSVAATRWHVAASPPRITAEHLVHRRVLPPPRWSLRLLRWKTAGLRGAMSSGTLLHAPSLWQTWTLEDLTHDAHGRKMVCLPPVVADAAIPPSTAAG